MVSRRYLLAGLIGGLAIAVATIAVTAILLSGDGEEEKEASAGETPVSAEVGAAQQTATPVPPTATSVPATATPEPEPTPLPDRTSCEEIRGTAYRSEQEREFFVANCIATPAPAGPTSTPAQAGGQPAQPVFTPPAQGPVQPTIEGWWLLLFDNGGMQTIRFDAQGRVVAFQPPARAPGLSGSGSISGSTMTINASGFVTDAGTPFSFTYSGTRLSDADFARLNLPPGMASFIRDTGGVAFRGQLIRSDLQAANTVVAIWVCRDCNVVFTPVP